MTINDSIIYVLFLLNVPTKFHVNYIETVLQCYSFHLLIGFMLHFYEMASKDNFAFCHM